MMRSRASGVATLGVLLLASGIQGVAQERPTPPPPAVASIRYLAIQHHGRLKPFDSFAREALTFITGRPRVGREDPVATVLSILADSERWQAEPLIWVPFGPLREALGLQRGVTRVSYTDLIATRRLMRRLPPIVEKQQRDEKLSMLEQETMDCYERFAALHSLFEQELRLVPPPVASALPSLRNQQLWPLLFEPTGYPEERQAAFRTAWTAFLAAVRAGQVDGANAAAREVNALLHAANPLAYPAAWRLRLEVAYNQVMPFRIVAVGYLAACVLLLLGLVASKPRAQRLGMGLVGMGLAVHGSGILIRVVLGGRPPVSNFYETMLWLPFVGVCLALIFERIYRVSWFGLAASILAAIMLILSDYVPLDSSISPVVAVLRSNLWLTIHVLTIVASYGALALATVLAHIYGVLYLLRGFGSARGAPPRQDATLAALETFLYRAMQVGVVLLAAGVMLGAVWANASWGRYWGWDPKETWALITLLWFLAMLHGRAAGWLQGVGIALATIGGFFLLLMTYYGVSFYLVGLHSYAGGHAKPLPTLLTAYLLAEVAFMAVVGLAAISRRSTRLRA